MCGWDPRFSGPEITGRLPPLASHAAPNIFQHGAVGKLDCVENGKLNASQFRQNMVNKRPNLT